MTTASVAIVRRWVESCRESGVEYRIFADGSDLTPYTAGGAEQVMLKMVSDAGQDDETSDQPATIVRAISGADCLDTVFAATVEARTAYAQGLWAAIWSVVSSLGLEVPSSGLEDPEVIVVRTPRGSPYSFIQADRRYLVVDEYASRVSHRWVRLLDYVEGPPDDLVPHLNELCAERAYLIHSLPVAAVCMASYHLEAELKVDLASFDSSGAQQRHFGRMNAQNTFVIAREMARLALAAMSPEARAALERKLFEFYRSGEPPAFPQAAGHNPPWDSPGPLRDRIAGSPSLLLECLCDALALVAGMVMGNSWRDSIVGAADGVRTLRLAAICDQRMQGFTPGCNPARDPDRHYELTLDLYTRTVALIWLSNQVRAVPEGWGVGFQTELTALATHEAKAKGDRLFDLVGRFAPGTAYLEAAKRGAIEPAELAVDTVAAAEDPAAARAFLGFVSEDLDRGRAATLAAIERIKSAERVRPGDSG